MSSESRYTDLSPSPSPLFQHSTLLGNERTVGNPLTIILPDPGKLPKKRMHYRFHDQGLIEVTFQGETPSVVLNGVQGGIVVFPVLAVPDVRVFILETIFGEWALTVATGIDGEQGPQGIQGIQGVQGDPGPSEIKHAYVSLDRTTIAFTTGVQKNISAEQTVCDDLISATDPPFALTGTNGELVATGSHRVQINSGGTISIGIGHFEGGVAINDVIIPCSEWTYRFLNSDNGSNVTPFSVAVMVDVVVDDVLSVVSTMQSASGSRDFFGVHMSVIVLE